MLTGPLSVSRFRVVGDFDPAELPAKLKANRFQPIVLESEQKISVGCVPIHPKIGWRLGDTSKSFAFTVRIQRRTPNANEVKWQMGDMLISNPSADPKKVKSEIEAKVLRTQTGPATSLVGCVIKDGQWVFLGTTAENDLSECQRLLSDIGVAVEPWAPWVGAPVDHPESRLVDTKGAGESLHGCNFLRFILAGKTQAIHPELSQGGLSYVSTDNGQEFRASIAGCIQDHSDLIWTRDQQGIPLRCKVVVDATKLTFIAKRFAIGQAKAPTNKDPHVCLEERINACLHLFEVLDNGFRSYLESFEECTPERNEIQYVLLARNGAGEEQHVIPGTAEVIDPTDAEPPEPPPEEIPEPEVEPGQIVDIEPEKKKGWFDNLMKGFGKGKAS